jgi:hypothetical protein
VVSSKVFAALDHYLWWLTYRWARRTHSLKPKRWIVRRCALDYAAGQQFPQFREYPWGLLESYAGTTGTYGSEAGETQQMRPRYPTRGAEKPLDHTVRLR